MDNFSIQSIYNWYRNSIRNPKYRWWVILGTIVYIVSPIDIAPDFIPIIGQIDDLVIFTLLVSEVGQWLIDSVKSRQSTTVNTEIDNPTEKTVDVESVSVKQ